VGTAIIWLPASVYLLLSGKMIAGIFLIVWGVVVIGLADNFIRPLLMKGKAALHPLLILFSILGGVAAFGLFGILLGPLAISLCTVFLQVYAKEAKETLEALSKK
jgi:predicted PurR-regulated permease PerM